MNESTRAILARHQGSERDALIPVLQEIQETFGCLSREAIIEISRHLGLSASKVYGVATFYNIDGAIAAEVTVGPRHAGLV